MGSHGFSYHVTLVLMSCHVGYDVISRIVLMSCHVGSDVMSWCLRSYHGVFEVICKGGAMLKSDISTSSCHKKMKKELT